MHKSAFSTPVTILVGMGFPRKISTALDAVRYLDDQPSMLRDEAFDVTYEVCRGALLGKRSVEEARSVLQALARRRGVLVEESWSHPSVVMRNPARA